MSLTSYRAAPPRATICVSVCLRIRLFRENKRPHEAALAANSGGQSKREDKTCVLQTWQRPTLPRLKTKYHRRWGVSRPCSEWERVQPPRQNHQVGKAQALLLAEQTVIEKLVKRLLRFEHVFRRVWHLSERLAPQGQRPSRLLARPVRSAFARQDSQQLIFDEHKQWERSSRSND
jgi:hypothetical protein